MADLEVRAAVLTGVGQALVVRQLQLAPPKAEEVLVRLTASGVCHSDQSVQNGSVPLPTPIVLGHEGAGVIEEVGSAVTDLGVGDHVVLSFAPECGSCFFCLRQQAFLCERGLLRFAGVLMDGTCRFSADGEDIHQMAMCGTFAERTVVPAISAVRIPEDVPLHLAALIGCGVLTGVGAALHAAHIEPGDRVVVVGCGGVGLNAVQGARIAGAAEIIAVDPVPEKRELARRFGATGVVDPGAGDPAEQVRGLTAGYGADVVLETAGRPDVILQALEMTRRGGQLVLVGLPALDGGLPSILDRLYYTARTVTACSYGSVNVHRDVPRLIDLYRNGRLLLDELVSEDIDLAQANDALADLATLTTAVRRLIRYD